MRTALGSSLLLLATAGLVAVPAAADAATACDAPDTTWVGPATWDGDRSWTLESNWSNGVPGVDSAVCIAAGAKADPLLPAGTTVTVAAVDASTDATNLDVEGSLTVTGSWDVAWLDVAGGQVLLGGRSALGNVDLRGGGRLEIQGDATLGPQGQVLEDDVDPGLLTVAASGVLTVETQPNNGNAVVSGALENHGTVHVVSGGLSVWGSTVGPVPADSGSDGTWISDPGTQLLLDSPVLLHGSVLEGVSLFGAHIPGGVVTASASNMWPSYTWPDPVPAVTGAGELVLTDDSQVGWGVGDQVTVRVPAGEQAALDGWLQDDARVFVEGTATHAHGGFAVLDRASLEVAPGGAMTWTDADDTGWELPDHPGTPTGTVVVDEGGTLVGGGPDGGLVRAVLHNHGTVRAEGGAFRVAPSPGTVVDGVLSAGRWEVGAGALLKLLDEAGRPTTVGAITGNAAQVALEGAGSSLRGLGALTTNRATGVLELGPGASLATAGRLRNAGHVTLDATATLATAGRFAQAAGGTLQVSVSQTAAGTVAAAGVRDLAGTLVLSPEGDAWPPLDTRRTFVTSDGRATRDDAFDTVLAPRLAALRARVRYGPDRTWFVVVATGAPARDASDR